jgi:hypothetical protein
VGRRGCAVPEKQATPACLLTTTVVRADGTTHVERLALALAIDCFYVYPTISGEPTINANLSVGFRERKVATARAARFSQVCRVYAPVYRQITLSALDHPNRITGRKLAAGRRYGVAARERSLLTRSGPRAWRARPGRHHRTRRPRPTRPRAGGRLHAALSGESCAVLVSDGQHGMREAAYWGARERARR